MSSDLPPRVLDQSSGRKGSEKGVTPPKHTLLIFRQRKNLPLVSDCDVGMASSGHITMGNFFPDSPFPSYLSPLSLNFLRVFRTLAHDRAYWVRGPRGPDPDLYLPLTFSFSNPRPRLPSPGPLGPNVLLHSPALPIAALSPAPMGE